MAQRKVKKGFTVLPLLLAAGLGWIIWRSAFVWQPAPPSVEWAVGVWLVQEAERYYVDNESLNTDDLVGSIDAIDKPLFENIRMKGDEAGAVVRVKRRFVGDVPRYARKKNRVRFFTLRKSRTNHWRVQKEVEPLDYYLRLY